MAGEYSLIPRAVPRVETPFRRIVTDLPVPESLGILKTLYAGEPIAMRGQPPIVWHRAEGFQVFDAWGNQWIDWSSGVLIANAGHGRQEIVDAIVAQASARLLTNYCFPSEIRARLVEKLISILPEPLRKVFLLTTGSEAVECAIKLCRTHGVKSGGRSKNAIVSFDKSFHGRTLGAQQAGGIPALKEWIVNLDGGFIQVPFPDGYRTPDTSFSLFERSLRENAIEPQNVAGVILETFQGGSAAFAPAAYMRDLRSWCTGHKALLVCDDVQAGFGRTGTLWGFEHYGIVPDLALFGKGISSSLPLAAVGPARRYGSASRREHDFYPWRQSGVLRGGASLDRPGAARESRRKLAPRRRGAASEAGRAGRPHPANWARGRQRLGRRHRVHCPRHQGTRCRAGLGRGPARG
jgi:4-aminobutyrate aminotransferase-like enzyme